MSGVQVSREYFKCIQIIRKLSVSAILHFSLTQFCIQLYRFKYLITVSNTYILGNEFLLLG